MLIKNLNTKALLDLPMMKTKLHQEYKQLIEILKSKYYEAQGI